MDADRSPFLLFEFPFPDLCGGKQGLVFADPVEILVAHSLEEVRPALRKLQRAVNRGLYAAGYLAYEAAPSFDAALTVQSGTRIPLLWFGLFREPVTADAEGPAGAFHVSAWEPSIDRKVYEDGVQLVRQAIARGETYQVNQTIRLRARFEGDDFAFYRHLSEVQRAKYCAYLHLGRFRVLSISPELFFHWQSDRITARPMKGTAPRGRWLAEDEAQATWLAKSDKNRAENLMIVDLLRSDLGRIAAIGSVHVPRLFEIERYGTIFQMTSTIEARPRPHLTLLDLFEALFPCGSVTGAPKVSTMRLIAALEDSPRQIYCGAIGFVTPRRQAMFNVAIRTVLIDTETGLAEYGVGSGITWASQAGDEYGETVTKAALLTGDYPRFSLLETLRLENRRYGLLERHLRRLQESARYFGVSLSSLAVREALEAHACTFPNGARRVRLLVSQQGVVQVRSEPLLALPAFPLPFVLAQAPVSRHNLFLFHKTTHRSVYEVRRSAHKDVYDVLLRNQEGELTEFTSGNLVVDLEGRCYTPSLQSGLLGGTFRADLLDRKEVVECVLTCKDLKHASRVWLVNSVRGWVPVFLSV